MVVESESWESLASFPFGSSCRTDRSDGECEIRLLSTGTQGVLKLRLRAVSRPDVDEVHSIDLQADRAALNIDFVIDEVGSKAWKAGFPDPLRSWTLPGLNRDDPRPMRLRFLIRDDRGNEIDDVPVAWEILPVEADAPPPAPPAPPSDGGVPMDAGFVGDLGIAADAAMDGAAPMDADGGADIGSVGLDVDGEPRPGDAAVDSGQGPADAAVTPDIGTVSDIGSGADAGAAAISEGETLQLRALTGDDCGAVDLPSAGQLDGEAEGLCLLPGSKAEAWRLALRWTGLVQPEMLAGDGEFRLDGDTRDSQPVAILPVDGAGDALDAGADVLLCQPGGPTDLARFRVVGAGGGGIAGVQVEFSSTQLEGVAPTEMRSSVDGIVYAQAICPNRNVVDSYLIASIPELRLSAQREVLVTPSDVDQLVVYGDGEARVTEVVTPGQRPFGLVVAGIDANGARMPEMDVRFRVMSMGHQEWLAFEDGHGFLHGQVLNTGRSGQVHLRLRAVGMATLGRPIQLLVKAVDRPVQKLLLVHIIPGEPRRMEVVSGSPIRAVVGGSGGPLEVAVLDEAGNGVPGIPVHWTSVGDDPEAALPEGIYLARTHGRTDALGVFRSWVTGLTRAGTLELKAWGASEQPPFEGTTQVRFEVGAGVPEAIEVYHRDRRLFDDRDGTIPFELAVGTAPVDPLVVRIENAQGGGMPGLGLSAQLIDGEPADCGQFGEGALQTDAEGEVRFGAEDGEPLQAGPRVALCSWRLSHGATGLTRTVKVGQVAGSPVGGTWSGHEGASLTSYVMSPQTFGDENSVEITLNVTDREGQPRVGTRVYLNGINCWIETRVQTTDGEGRARWRVAGGRSVGSCEVTPDWMGETPWENPPRLELAVGHADAANILNLEPRRIEQQSSRHTLRLYTENVRRPNEWANGEAVDEGPCYDEGLAEEDGGNPYAHCTRAQLLRAERAGPHGWSYTLVRDLPLRERFSGQTPVHEVHVDADHTLDGGHFALRLMQEDGTLGNIFHFWVEPTHYWRGDRVVIPNPPDRPDGNLKIKGGHRVQWDDDEDLEIVVCGVDDRGGFITLVDPTEAGRLPYRPDLQTLRTWHCQMRDDGSDNCATNEWPYSGYTRPGTACIVRDFDDDGTPDVLVPTNTSAANPVPRLLAFKGTREAPYFEAPVALYLNEESRRRAPHGITLSENPRRISLCYAYNGYGCENPSRGVSYQSTIEFQGNPFAGDPQATIGRRLEGLAAGWGALNDHGYTPLADPLGSLTKETQFHKGVYRLDGEPNGAVSRHPALDIMFHPDGSQAFYVADYSWGGRSPAIMTFGTESHRREAYLHTYSPLSEREPEVYNWERPSLRSNAAVLRSDGRQMLLLGDDHLLVADLTQSDVVDRGAVVRDFEFHSRTHFAWSADGSILVGIRNRYRADNLRAVDLRPDVPVTAWEVSSRNTLGVSAVKSLTGEPELDLVVALAEGLRVDNVDSDDRVILLRLSTGEVLWSQPRPHDDGRGLVDLSPDGRWVAVSSHTSKVRIYEGQDGALMHDLRPCKRNPNAEITSLRFVPATAAAEASLLVACSREPLQQITLSGDYLRAWSIEEVDRLRVSPNGRQMLVQHRRPTYALSLVNLDDSSLGACLDDYWCGSGKGGHLATPFGDHVMAQPDHLDSAATFWRNHQELFVTRLSQRRPGCGDGVVEAPERFDPGPLLDVNGWSGECGAVCGDGVLDPGEDCDDGNDVDEDRCPNTCRNRYAELQLGKNHGCVIDQGGVLSCWGYNDQCQLGHGNYPGRCDGTFRKSLRTRLDHLGPVRQVAVGSEHTCALTEAGVVWCWGDNHYRQLGPNRTVHARFPAQVLDLPDGIVELQSGRWSNCVRTESGEVWCWGYKAAGLHSSDSAPAMRLRGVGSGEGELRAVSFKIWHGRGCVRLEDESTRCFGYLKGMPSSGALDGEVEETPFPSRTLWGAAADPIHLSLLDDLADFGIGEDFLCGRTEAGTVFCSGRNQYGQSGRPVEEGSTVPWGLVEGLSGVTDLSVGRGHACAVDGSHDILCWGYEESGRLGRGEELPGNSQPVPAPVQPQGVAYDRVWSAEYANCGRLLDRGEFRCWGYSRHGVLNGTWNPNTTYFAYLWSVEDW
ncbi:MAG: hypothetical protein CMH55_03990 [Myxococcales bacterium]|nr:hypothetical protein [Myxococcales bacterium]